jgi:nucleoside-diphosphate-sugar epimerase
MKIIVTGATGFVGQSVVETCVADDSITTIFILSRRPLDEPRIISSDKVVTILHNDFLNYDDNLLRKLSGVSACLWCIGGRHTQTSRWPTHAEYVKVSVDYALAAAKAFTKSLAPQLDQGERFRFVLCSGHATELDQNKKLWIMGPTRKVKVGISQCQVPNGQHVA